MGAWLNYYIKSIRRLGRGPDRTADLGEKSGMVGSCERDACGSARLGANAARPFAAHHAVRTAPVPAMQGISSTDKDVINPPLRVGWAGGLSSSLSGADTSGISARCAGPLAHGRYAPALDTDVVSVKLPREAARALRHAWGQSGAAGMARREQNSSARSGGVAKAARRPSFASGGPSVLPAPTGAAGRNGSGDNRCRAQQGIRRERPAL